jgi:DNA-binding NtrC family response regulator
MKATILYAEANAKAVDEQLKMFEKAGYAVVTAIGGRAAVEQAVKSNAYGLVILGHTLTKDDRHHLPYMIKKANSAARILVLHASCKHPKVDFALDSRDGERAVLKAVAQLMPVTDSRAARAMSAVA